MTSWNTKLTKLLDISYPIIQGAMAYISDGRLAAAMSHAGGSVLLKIWPVLIKYMASILCCKIKIKRMWRRLYVMKKSRL